MNLQQLLRGRAQRAWRVFVAGPSAPHTAPIAPPTVPIPIPLASPAPPLRVGWVPLSAKPLRRKRSTDAGPWNADRPDAWKR